MTTSGATTAAARLLAVAETAACLASTPVDAAELAGTAVGHLVDLLGGGAALWLYASGGEDVARSGDVPAPLLPALHELVDAAGMGGHDGCGPVHGQCLAAAERYGIASVAAFPVRARGRALGALALTRTAAQPDLDAADLALAQTLADLVGAAADAALLVDGATAAYEEVRRQSELVDQVSDAIISVDADHCVMSWNAAAERIYGYSAGEAAGCELFALLATRLLTTDGAPAELAAVIDETVGAGEWRGELRQRSAAGAELELLASFAALTDEAGEPAGLVIVNRDMTEQRRKEHLATHDPLTGLANRARADETLRKALARASRNGSTLAVAYLDLDGFKPVNDRFGHDAGDEVLKVIAQRLNDVVRRSDLVARLGGDEFLIVAEDVGDRGAELLGERLLAATGAPIMVAGHAVIVPPSIGIALSRDGLAEAEELVKAADAAMYAAKQQRRGLAYAAS
jgi:diguanylate cyclase (GGDEF)-like protein/PAS domain S-box-containing protein